MAWTDVENSNNNSDNNKLEYTKFEPGKSIDIRIFDEEPVSKWRHWLPASKRSVTCLGKECPVCKVIKQQKADGIKPFTNSTFKHTIHILNRSTGNVELLEQGKGFFEQLLGYMKAMGDLRKFDLRITRNGTGTNTSYVMIPMGAKDLTQEEIDMYEANKEDLVKKLTPYTVEQTQGLMDGVDPKEVFADINNASDKNETIEF